MIFIVMIASFALCFSTRVAITLGTKMVFDSWGHFYFIKKIQKERRGPFDPLEPNVVASGPFHYPILTHWLLSFIIPRHISSKSLKLINPLFEATALTIYVYLASVAGLSIVTIQIAASLFIFTPILFSKISIGPVGHFTTRIYSEIAVNIIVLLTFLPIPISSLTLGIIIAILTFYTLLSSKFGTQVVILLLVPTFVVTVNITAIMAISGGFLLSLLLTRGQVVGTWHQQWSHLKWYFREARRKSVPIISRNKLEKFREAIDSEHLKSSMINLLFTIAARNSFTAVLVKFPVAVVMILLPFLAGAENVLSFERIYYLIYTVVVLFVIVNTTVFIILGEAERYLVHISFLIILYFSEFVYQNELTYLYWIVLVWGVAYWAFEIIVLGVLGVGKVEHDEDGALEFLNVHLLPDSTVLSWPYHILPPWRILAETGHRAVFPIIATGEGASRLKSLEEYPFLDLGRTRELRESFGVNCLIIDEKKATSEILEMIEADDWKRVSKPRISGILIFIHPLKAIS